MTYKEIIDTIENICLDHLRIETFQLGSPVELGTGWDIRYVASYLEQETLVNVDYNLRCVYNMALLVLDRTREDLTERRQVLTQTQQIGLDLVRKFEEYNIISGQWAVTMTPYTEAQMDRVWGWRIEFSVEADLDPECILPFATI